MIWVKASPSLGATQPLDRVLKGWEENLHLKNEFTNICYKNSPIFDMWNHQYLISRCTIFMFVFIWYFCKIDIEVGSTVFVVCKSPRNDQSFQNLETALPLFFGTKNYEIFSLLLRHQEVGKSRKEHRRNTRLSTTVRIPDITL